MGPGIDGIWLDMAVHTDKKQYARRVEADRMRMTALAVAQLPAAGVTRLQAQMGKKGFGVEYFDMLRALLTSASAGAPGGERPRITWVMGTDVVMGMRWWQRMRGCYFDAAIRSWCSAGARLLMKPWQF